MGKEKALQILDGLMLGDGNLQRYADTAVYHMSQSKRPIVIDDHLKWEYWLKDNVFAALGITATVKPYWRVYSSGPSEGQRYQLAQLWTESSTLLAGVYDEWYAGGCWSPGGSSHYMRGAVKNLPGRIMHAAELPIHSLVHWFLGDGGSSWHHLERVVPLVLSSFSAYKFTEREVSHLISMLNNVGVETTRGSKLRIYIAQDGVNHFMSLIEPYILEIFGDSVGSSYKDMIKYRIKKKL